ncbi:MFS transporter [Rathayibacter sp. VKM Ac-2805]|uniref:MFS transporter n=1 Tax=Rathayibacter sp. VKM Ac-2805 TaxID=2609258 RepID=UPI00132006DA|nr:MFS transporter [Rathayibacter sp. VKM Ac-2805]QHC75041.1 MFS transporter [Rathayibacter sp. VKM Ac-2805]
MTRSDSSAPSAARRDPAALSPLRLRLLVGSLLAVSFLGALDHTVVSTSLATIAGDIGALDQMSWVIVAYTLASTVLLPVLGRIGDQVGPRRVFLASLVLFLLASLVCGFASDLPQLIAARVVQGMSSAGLQLMSQTIVATVTTLRDRPRVMSIVGAAFPLAILIGPVLGGLITDTVGWPWIFWINLPVGTAALVLALWAVPALPPRGRRSFDGAGAVALTVALVGLVVGVTRLGAGLDATTVSAFAAAVVGAAVLVVVERRSDVPILPLHLLRDRTVACAIALSAIIGVGLFSIVSYVPTFIQMAYRTSATVSGLVPIATVFGMLVANIASGWIISRSGRYRAFPVVGTSLATLGLAAMAVVPHGSPLVVPMALMAVVGIGTGCFMSLIVVLAQSGVAPGEIGAITATSNLVRQMGSTIGTAAIGGSLGAGVAALLPAGVDAARATPAAVRSADAATQEAVASAYADVMAPIFLVLAGVYALGIVVAALLPAARLSDEQPPPSAAPLAEAAPASTPSPVPSSSSSSSPSDSRSA